MYCASPSEWGITFLLFLTVAAAAYVGGGVFAGGGKGVTAHPHHNRWLDFHGLVQDGIVFARARAQGKQVGRGAASAAPLLEEEEMRRNGSDSGGKDKTSKSASSKTSKERQGSKESNSGSLKSTGSSGERKSKRPSGSDRGGAVKEPAAEPPAPADAATGTHAGDGGRWVRVPG